MFRLALPSASWRTCPPAWLPALPAAFPPRCLDSCLPDWLRARSPGRLPDLPTLRLLGSFDLRLVFEWLTSWHPSGQLLLPGPLAAWLPVLCPSTSSAIPLACAQAYRAGIKAGAPLAALRCIRSVCRTVVTGGGGGGDILVVVIDVVVGVAVVVMVSAPILLSPLMYRALLFLLALPNRTRDCPCRLAIAHGVGGEGVLLWWVSAVGSRRRPWCSDRHAWSRSTRASRVSGRLQR